MRQAELEFEDCPPRADAMIQSMRAIGYNLGMAVADLIDNSLAAGAHNAWVIQEWAGADSYMAVLDDGRGMVEDQLVEAMRLGSLNPLEERSPDDLGRFGLGLKTASFSQCRRVTVRTKTKGGRTVTRCWDLDVVNSAREWRLLKKVLSKSEKRLTFLDRTECGTIVLWEELDRVVEASDSDDKRAHDDFLRKIDSVREYLEMVFHRYLDFRGRLSIYICSPDTIDDASSKLRPWDPFVTNHLATQELSNEAVETFGSRIRVRPFVLPHVSKLSSLEHERAAGPKGWNAQQGFYIFRKERLIVAGSWLDLGLKQEEHYKLARISVEIPNSMDAEWKIDVKKAEAHPPDSLRDAFRRIAKITRERAADVYRHRGRTVARQHDRISRFVWKKVDKRGKVKYLVDRDHPIIEAILERNRDAKKDIGELLRIVESTVPIEQIVITNSEAPDSHLGSADSDLSASLKEWFESLVLVHVHRGLSKAEAQKLVLSIEPFCTCPELIALVEEKQSARR